MKTFAYILVLIILSIIVYQDFKYKAVSWFLFPVLFVPPLYLGFVQVGWERLWMYFVTNFGFLLIQFLLLIIYLSIKNKKITILTKGYLGLGDILFLIVLCLFFSSVNYILFYLFSLIAILIAYLLYNTFRSACRREVVCNFSTAGVNSRQKNLFKEEIPLAGGIALILICLILFKFINQNVDFYSDLLLY